MIVLITKVSEDYYFDFKDFQTFDDLISFMKESKHPLVLGQNDFYDSDPQDILKYWDTINDLEIAKNICECKYEVEIYDDWIE